MWDYLLELLSSLSGIGSSRRDENNSLVGASEFERETAIQWGKWAFALGLLGLAGYGLWSLWAGN